jgi:ECF sigma factor
MRNDVEPTIPALFEAADRGEPSAADALFSLDTELHRLARRELQRQGGPVSLGATTLLHRPSIDVAARHDVSFPDEPSFMGYAARVMRGIIIDHARSRHALKRGGAIHITTSDSAVPGEIVDEAERRRLGEELDRLEQAAA